ncbi:MAG: hypothetical protein RSA70_05480, partial [Clostridia bacterium]
ISADRFISKENRPQKWRLQPNSRAILSPIAMFELRRSAGANTQVRAYCIFSTCRFARYIFDPIFSRLSVRAPSYIHANNGFTPTGF